MAPKKFLFQTEREIPVKPVTVIPSEWSIVNLSQADQDDLLRRVSRAASNVARMPGIAVITVSPSKRIRLTLNRQFASGVVTPEMVEGWEVSLT